MGKILQSLRLAKQALTPETWCQGELGYDANGSALFADGGAFAKRAVQFCAMGALAKVNAYEGMEGHKHHVWWPLRAALRELRETRPLDARFLDSDSDSRVGVAEYNDHPDTTLDDIHALYDIAIQIQQEKQR